MNRKKMAVLFNEKFGKTKTYENMKRFCCRYKLSRDFELDKKPKNKTTFKKGMKAHNVMDIGQEYINPSNGFVMIKTDKGRMLKHHHVWGEPIPHDMQISFIDGDRTNCEKSNLMLVTKAESLRFNQLYARKADASNRESFMLLAQIKTAIHKAS